MDFGSTFSVIGRNPVCGCPLAIDLNADHDAQQEFLKSGLLVEIVPETVALDIWSNASWPCRHSSGRSEYLEDAEEKRDLLLPMNADHKQPLLQILEFQGARAKE